MGYISYGKVKISKKIVLQTSVIEIKILNEKHSNQN